MERKSLYDISWKVDEPTYRADPALSYSTLSKYEETGFNNLNNLFEKVETPSLTFGSAVDSIITGCREEFEERFMVAEYPSTPDSIVKIVKDIFKEFNTTHSSLDSIPDSEIIYRATSLGYQPNWKPETRAKVIKEKGKDYYNLLFIAGDRIILDTKTYQDVCNAVKVLKTSNATKFYFEDNNPFDLSIERYYQLKFKGEFEGIVYRNMADLIIVNYKEKWILPVDLKTSSHAEWDFYKSFINWKYQIQARLYWRIIRQNLDKDDYFKDFKLLDYKFIVVNKRTLTPLVWGFPFTQTLGTLKFGKNGQIEMRDPFDIGKELNYYISNRPSVPIGIKEDSSNDLGKWLNTL